MTLATDSPRAKESEDCSPLQGISERLRRVVDVHFDPRGGSRFWLEWARKRSIDPRKELRCLEDLAILGEMTPDQLKSRPLIDCIPRSHHGGLHRFINVYVNDEDVRYLGSLETELSEGDTVSLLPAVAGG